MLVKTLDLVDFRNYASLHLQLTPGVTVLCGHNAQGKTNIVEALHLLATGRSHRTRHDKELIRWQAGSASASILLERRDGMHRLQMRLGGKERKQALLDEVPAPRLMDMLGQFNAVLFSPEDLGLIKDGPAQRRRFMDMEISQMRPTYCYALAQYQRALAQRNQIIKNWSSQPQWQAMLPEWDNQLCRAGAQVMLVRAEVMQQLTQLAGQQHTALAGQWLDVVYQPNLIYDVHTDAAQLAQIMAGKLKEDLQRDIARAGTSTGPHRDDIAITLNGIDLRTYGSQGQQRSAALCLKLAELELMHQQTGEMPVLLLDDVMSELDESRRTMLLNRTHGAQTIITCTNAEALPPFNHTPHILHVHNGQVDQG